MDLSNLFNQFTTRDSIFILIVMIIAFLFGLMVGYLLRSRRVRQLRRELKDKKKELADARAEIETLREQLSLKDADLKKLGFSLQEAEAGLERVNDEKEQLNKEIFMLNRRLEEGGSTDASYQAVVDELNEELSRLRKRNEELNQALQASDGGPVDQAAQLQSTSNANRRRLETLEQKVTALEGALAGGEGGRPRQLSTHSEEQHPDIHPMPGLPDAPLVEEEPEMWFSAEKPYLEKIPASIEARDDLTRIDGIGRFLEEQLNRIGVHTYEELSTWDSARVEEVTAAISYFPGRIEKDRWVEQAAQLALKKQKDPEAFKPKIAPFSEDPSDLTIIEGIGPMVTEALRTAGIETWGDLAAADTARLREILEASGPNYYMHDPNTWPDQAKLAMQGEWGVLQAYQEELRGG